MTKEELELVEKVLSSEKIYMVIKMYIEDEEDAIHDIRPEITNGNGCLWVFFGNHYVKLIDDYGIKWAFDEETLLKTRTMRIIEAKKKEIENLQNEIKELEECQ